MTIKFNVQCEKAGGHSAQAIELPIFTQGDSFEELRVNIKDALGCYFEAPFKGVVGIVLTERID